MRILYLWGNIMGVKALLELERLLKAGVLNQEYIDVKVYYVDGIPQAAYYPICNFRNRFYSVLPYGIPPELKIVRNKVPHADAEPRALINFDYTDRYPPIDESLGLRACRCQVSNQNSANNKK